MAEPATNQNYDDDDYSPEAQEFRVIEGGGESTPSSGQERAKLKAAPEPVYDDEPARGAKRAGLSSIPGGGESSEPTGRGKIGVAGGENDPNRRRFGFGRKKRGDDARGLSGDQLHEGESEGGESDKGKVGNAESAMSDFANDAAMAAEIAGGRYGRIINFLAKRKKKAAGGGIILGLIFMVIFAFNIAQGPLQVIHLGQVLGKSFSNQDNAANIREKGLLRWFRTGNPGETRVGKLGSEINKRAMAKLADEGITFEVDTGNGHLAAVNIDQAKNSKYAGMSEADARAQIAKDNGIPLDKVLKVGEGKNGALFKFDARGLSFSSARDVISSAMDAADFGKIARAVAFRPVADYLGKPGILHPWKRAKAKLSDVLFSSDEQKKLIQEEEKSQSSISEQTPEAKAVVEDVRDEVGKESGVRSATNIALGVQAGLCLAREIADKVPDLNWGTVVQPAASLATFAMAEGSQTQAGDDLAVEQPGAAVANYTNKAGQTIWESRPLQALSGIANPSGIDLPSEFKQAFNFTSTTANIVKTLDSYGANYLCSTVAQIGGAVIGVALIATGPGGTITEKLLSSGGQLIAGAVVANAIMQFVPKLIASAAPPVTTLTGPLGGGFVAYGSRAMANMTYASFGGTALSAAESAQLTQENDRIHQEQLQSESFATRIFNPYNSDSLLAKTIDFHNISPILNFSSLITSFAHPMRILSTFSDAIFPKADAQAATEYDYGDFKQLGISLKDLKNPKYDNPENADAVAKILDSSSGDDYIKKAETCFGDVISKGTDGWDVKQHKSVNPASAEYQEAGCDNTDTAWTRMKFFAFDTLLAKGDICYHGDQSVCKELGFDNDQTATGPSGPDTGATGATVGDFAWPVPIKYVENDWSWFTQPHHDHPSSDIPVPEGTDVYSVTGGKVTYVCTGDCAGYGNVIAIVYKDGLFRYQHGLTGSIKVKVGDTVTPGEKIMSSDNTGFSTGPHLHVSIETGGSGTSARDVEHCPQALWKAMKAKDTKVLGEPFSNLPTTGCVGGASLY